VVADGSATAVIANRGAATEIVIADDFVWVGCSVSLSTMLKENFPATVGVPEMIPVDAARDKPEGSDPEVTFQV
jgi:hypothetical protein